MPTIGLFGEDLAVASSSIRVKPFFVGSTGVVVSDASPALLFEVLLWLFGVRAVLVDKLRKRPNRGPISKSIPELILWGWRSKAGSYA